MVHSCKCSRRTLFILSLAHASIQRPYFVIIDSLLYSWKPFPLFLYIVKRKHSFTEELETLRSNGLHRGNEPRVPREIPQRRIELMETLGRGNFGDVLRGLIKSSFMLVLKCLFKILPFVKNISIYYLVKHYKKIALIWLIWKEVMDEDLAFSPFMYFWMPNFTPILRLSHIILIISVICILGEVENKSWQWKPSKQAVVMMLVARFLLRLHLWWHAWEEMQIWRLVFSSSCFSPPSFCHYASLLYLRGCFSVYPSGVNVIAINAKWVKCINIFFSLWI